MKLGFHYHIPAMQHKDGSIWMPGYLGVFVDGLAREVDHVVLFLHRAKKEEEAQMDYRLSSKNITLVSLPFKVHMLVRPLLAFRYLDTIKKNISTVDIMLVRAPTPLLPAISRLCVQRRIKVSFLLVGDYVKSLQENHQIIWFKKLLLGIYYKSYQTKQQHYMRYACLLCNNPLIKQEYEKLGFEIGEVRTTTLTQKDFSIKQKEFAANGVVKLAYAGRIEPSKGIEDILSAVEILNTNGVKAEIHVAGWDPSPSQHYLSHIHNLVKKKKLNDKFFYHGKKQVGQDLLTFYRNSDIFMMASNANEGFPRTIWEAMSQNTLVVATRVGSVDIILKDHYHALIVEPNSPRQLAYAVQKLITDKELRDFIYHNANRLVSDNTIEIQSKKMIEFIRNCYEK